MDKQGRSLYYCDMFNGITVRINRLARFYCKSDWSWDVAGRSNWTEEENTPCFFNFNLWAILQGVGELKAPEGIFELRAGECFILRGNEHYTANHDPSDPLVVFAVHFDFIDHKGEIFYPETQFFRKIEHVEFFAHMQERMESAWLGRSGDAEFWLEACLKEIGQQDRESAIHGYKRKQVDIIRGICAEIRRYPGEQYSVDDLAQRLHCSRYHFTRLFKEVNNVSPQEFIVDARIEAAKGLLHSSNYTIGRIANLLGYSDIYFFSRQFKNKTGCSPSQYRQY